ncbi:unnamed protein product [Trichogramma brassicae]|uniref:Uncharacterized protein n=1 Tax=Trichogramma brassicae TaxID=86971 RepID=A0A6H5J4C1_9HYME|nr:unnamed protein product [Trichogramma brassicae]
MRSPINTKQIAHPPVHKEVIQKGYRQEAAGKVAYGKDEDYPAESDHRRLRGDLEAFGYQSEAAAEEAPRDRANGAMTTLSQPNARHHPHLQHPTTDESTSGSNRAAKSSASTEFSFLSQASIGPSGKTRIVQCRQGDANCDAVAFRCPATKKTKPQKMSYDCDELVNYWAVYGENFFNGKERQQRV